MSTPDDRERESRESEETLFEQRLEQESEERHRLAERLAHEQLEPVDEKAGD